MSEDLNVFPNAKSPLFGAGEDSVGIIVTPATAKLIGVVSSTPDSGNVGERQGVAIAVFALQRNQGITTNFVPFTVSNVVVAAGEKVLLTYIFTAGTSGNFQTGAETHSIRRNGSGIASFNTPNYAGTGPILNRQIIDSPGAGTFSYDVIFPNTTNHGSFSYISIRANVIKIDDTHDGAIDTVAIAGKNIITPDSHTTREISVLPG